MTLPKSVEIGGVKFSICIEEDLPDFGQFCFDDRKISLRNESDAIMLETLNHEMMHAAFEVAGVSHLKHYEEECIVRCLENIHKPAWSKLLAKLKR